MLDVAAVAETRAGRGRVLRKALSKMLGIEDAFVAATVAAIAALHDIGKLDSRFQSKAPDAAQSAGGGDLPKKLGVGWDHGAGGYGHLLRSEAAIRPAWGQAAMPLLRAATGHHGALAKRREAEDAAAWPEAQWRRMRRADEQARAAFVDDVAQLFRRRGARLPLPGDSSSASAATLLMAGLCSVADWIGSSADFFPYVVEPVPLDEYYETHALPRAERALGELALRGARPSSRGFEQLFGFEPDRDVQRLTTSLELPDGPCLVVVEGPMGSGKTEAALDLAARLLANGSAEAIYFALPTMATSNAMLERLTRDVPRMFEGDVSLVLSHGRRRSNERFERIVRTPAGSGPYDDEASVICHRWLLGNKRGLLGQVGVGTVDQAMLGALRARHHFVRLYALADSAVILDEVHAYDAYMSVILDRLVEWLGALGAPVVLLSATLPRSTRRRFVAAYAQGAKLCCDEPGVAPAPAPYPLVTTLSREGLRESHGAASAPPRTVQIERLAEAEPEAAVLGRLTERGGMVAWIRNTVGDAQRAWDARPPGVETILFHARLRAKDRAAVEERVIRTFGKGAARGHLLLIATQVVEQSLDLDFDALATDLAPIDLLLQRAGRLHRHDNKRPAGLETARLLVVSPAAEDAAQLAFGGSGYVYDRATLGVTLDLLGQTPQFSIPDDLRPLVEAVYDPGLRATRIAGAPNRAALEEAAQQGNEERARREQDAKKRCIAPTGHDLTALETVEDDDDETLQMLTRDGASTTLLPVLWDGEHGRSLDGGEPWTLAAESTAAWQEARALLDETLSVPAHQIPREARGEGNGAWERFQERAKRFLEAMGTRRAVLVPMRKIDAEWEGTLRLTKSGRLLQVGYSVEKGLWFPA